VEKVTENSKDQILGNTSARGPIGSIKSVRWSSLNFKFWNTTSEFSQHNYFLNIFCRKNSDIAAKTWHPVVFGGKIELWNGMSCIRLVSQKYSNNVYRKRFIFFEVHSGKFLQTLSFYPTHDPLVTTSWLATTHFSFIAMLLNMWCLLCICRRTCVCERERERVCVCVCATLYSRRACPMDCCA